LTGRAGCTGRAGAMTCTGKSRSPRSCFVVFQHAPLWPRHARRETVMRTRPPWRHGANCRSRQRGRLLRRPGWYVFRTRRAPAVLVASVLVGVGRLHIRVDSRG
jgi:hypothetical protein